MTGAITVTVAQTRGSAPRDVGAQMQVWPDRITGSIGGGALEWEAIGHAREMMAKGQTQSKRSFALGPDMGQCCGGAVTLEFDAGAQQTPEQSALWIWGAGHVGRAIAAVVAPTQLFSITVVDVDQSRFPTDLADSVDPLVAADPLRLVNRLPVSADHIIVTYSHDLDLNLCDALLHQGFQSCGLIGSATKWARFRKRLRELGHSAGTIDQIQCPIGDPSLGKHPQAIAVGVAATLCRQRSGERSNP